MKIRLISDLHIDINSLYPLDLHENGANDVYTLVAGDICGNPHRTVEWVKKNIHQGAFICGNHDVYDIDMPIEDVKWLLHEEFPASSNVTFFDNDVGVVSKEIGDGILLVADVLYTDYSLKVPWRNANGNVDKNMWLADPYRHISGGMNDFNFGRCKKEYVGWNDTTKHTKDSWRLVPPWYLDHHKAAFAKITSIVEENQDKQIVLMAHHGLSPQCLDDNYRDDASADASYASDKEAWIAAHPNIKCIFSGHIHARKKFNIGGCLYVMNSLGYCNRNLSQYDKTSGKWVNWTPNCFLDTDSWTVSWEHIANVRWEEEKKKSDDKFASIVGLFM